MELTNGEIFKAKRPQASNRMSSLDTLMANKFPVKVSYGLVKLSAKLEVQYQIIEKTRIGLCQTYGTPDPRDARQFNVLPIIEGKANPEYERFMGEIEELMAQTVELVIDEVTLPDTLEVEPSVLMALDKFLKVT